MTVWWAEVMLVNWSAFLCFCWSTNSLLLLSSVTRKLYVITVSISKAFLMSWLLVQKKNPPTIPSLSLIFSFFCETFHFLFLHVTLIAMFLIPPILRSHYNAVELWNGARGYQLNEFCPVASIYCALSQMQVTLCVCWIWLHIYTI